MNIENVLTCIYVWLWTQRQWNTQRPWIHNIWRSHSSKVLLMVFFHMDFIFTWTVFFLVKSWKGTVKSSSAQLCQTLRIYWKIVLQASEGGVLGFERSKFRPITSVVSQLNTRNSFWTLIFFFQWTSRWMSFQWVIYNWVTYAPSPHQMPCIQQ